MEAFKNNFNPANIKPYTPNITALNLQAANNNQAK